MERKENLLKCSICISSLTRKEREGRTSIKCVMKFKEAITYIANLIKIDSTSNF